MYKDPNCGCGTAWVDHVRENGYKVKSVNSEDMAAVKKRLGVPETLQSCHPSVVEASGQFFEGHVPAAALAKLIAKRSVKGVAVPGMPANSPGMVRWMATLLRSISRASNFPRINRVQRDKRHEAAGLCPYFVRSVFFISGAHHEIPILFDDIGNRHLGSSVFDRVRG